MRSGSNPGCEAQIMKLEEMEEIHAEREAKAAANKALAQRWLGNHNVGDGTKHPDFTGWSYPCRNNCHSHCQSVGLGTCKCPCHDNEWGDTAGIC